MGPGSSACIEQTGSGSVSSSPVLSIRKNSSFTNANSTKRWRRKMGTKLATHSGKAPWGEALGGRLRFRAGPIRPPAHGSGSRHAHDCELGRGSALRSGRGRGHLLGGKPARPAPDGKLGRHLGRVLRVGHHHFANRSPHAGENPTPGP